MREEYKAITDAGLNVQLDDPIIVNVYEWHYSMSGDMAAFRKWAEVACGIGEPRAEGHPGRKGPISHLLGQLERSAQRRPSTARRDRPHAEGESQPVFRGSGEPAARARMEGLEGREASGRQSRDSRRGDAQDQCAGASRGSRRSHSCVTPKPWAGRTSSPAPIAAWAAASIRQLAWAKLRALSAGAGAGEQAALGENFFGLGSAVRLQTPFRTYLVCIIAYKITGTAY